MTEQKQIKEEIIKEILKKHDINFEWHKAQEFKKTYGRKFVDWVIIDAFNKGRKQALEEVNKIIEDLNSYFRKSNIPQRLTGDEFNDVWEEELKSKIKELKK